MEGFEPKLTSIDWNEEWKRLQAAREHFDDPAKWDERAATFHTRHGSHSDYADRFIELAQLKPGETVLDMGCGTGALAIPLALAGHRVIAADFSEGMLGVLADEASRHGASGIEIIRLSWDEDWAAAGLSADCVDVAFASRSIATADLGASLSKLETAARRRACITLPRSSSPRSDESLMRACGVQDAVGRDFLYAFNILASRGRAPEVAYIDTVRREHFASEEEAVVTISEIARSAVRGYLDDEEIAGLDERIRPWVLERLMPAEDGTLTLEPPRSASWAFLAWDCA